MELKPCPHCNGPAHYSPGNYKGVPTCEHCGATARDEGSWNRRAESPLTAAERAVVEAAMEYERVRIHTQDASEWNAVKLMLREACAALARARKEAEK